MDLLADFTVWLAYIFGAISVIVIGCLIYLGVVLFKRFLK